MQLNKPMYKAPDDENFTPPKPREPRSNMFGRSAALFLDIMLLHLLLASITRFVPDIPLGLGPLAPWVGLLIGFLYFGFGFSQVTLGRTIGKMITRVQVADIKGPDLTIGRAFLRAALFLWPLAVQQIFHTISEHYANSNPISLLTTLDAFGTMLIIGWVLGNLGFAIFDPFRRTLYDRMSGSVVINAELEPEPVAEYLLAVRYGDSLPPQKISMTCLGLSLTICLAVAAASVISLMRSLRDITPEEKTRVEALVVPHYGRAWPAPPMDDAPTTGIVPVGFQFRKRGKFDMDTLKSDPVASATLESLITAMSGPEFIKEMQDYLSSANIDSLKRGEQPTSAPGRIRFEVSFAEYADMFFAREAHPVYTLSRDVSLPTTVTEAINR